MEKAEHPRRMIAYPVIERAVSGDTEAIGLILSMLKQLFSKKLINENEYQKIKKS